MKKTKIRVNIASSHRFHLLDLARELDKQGFDVMFYSYVPNKRCQFFGLPKKCCVSLLWLIAPFYILMKVFGNKEFLVKYRNIVMDKYLSWFMRPCDIFIALGTVYKDSLLSAKKRFGAKTILEWGSMHINDQQRILKECGAHLQDEYFNQRSRDGYELADYIAIPALHTKKSFMAHGLPEEKLIVNPYGVDVSMFYPIKYEKKYDVIMVGNWSKQKGCDIIVDAIRETGLSFIHVGALADIPFPSDDNFTHVEPVNQPLLVNYLNEAKVFLMPTRQDGFGMVYSQALACNLPIIGSVNSGAVDLKGMVDYPEYITVIDKWTKDDVTVALRSSLEKYNSLGNTFYAGNALANLTWEKYGERYLKNINTILK